ncbi:MAG: DUF5119 domain-containing protein [Prevotella sp.]
MRLHAYHLILYIVAALLGSCTYIEALDVDEPSGKTILTVDCGAEKLPQKWHFEVVDDNDSLSHYYSEDGSVSIAGGMAYALVYNTDVENIRFEEDKNGRTTIARLKPIDDPQLNNGLPVAYMPDMLYSKYLEVQSPNPSSLVAIPVEPLTKSRMLEIRVSSSVGNVVGTTSALVDGMAEYIDMTTLELSNEAVSLFVPLWVDETTRSSGNAEATISGTLNTFGKSRKAVSNSMTFTLSFEDGTKKSVAIDLTDEMEQENKVTPIVKNLKMDDSWHDAEDNSVAVEDRETENTHVSL